MSTPPATPASAALTSPRLPDAVVRRGLSEAAWRTLLNHVYPGATADAVLMVVDYCAARKLDPLKKPCHLVPMRVRNARTNQYEWRDVVLPGIYEYRTTAHRTGQYLGHSAPQYGPMREQFGVTAPEWCAMTMYRLVNGRRAEFPVIVFFREVVALRDDPRDPTKPPVANARWQRAPIQMLTKCTEAAGHREAFPEELGGEPTAEEVGNWLSTDSADWERGLTGAEDRLWAGLMADAPPDDRAELRALSERAGLNKAAVAAVIKKHAGDMRAVRAELAAAADALAAAPDAPEATAPAASGPTGSKAARRAAAEASAPAEAPVTAPSVADVFGQQDML